MTTRTCALAVVAAVALLGTACPGPSGGSIYPMTVGSVWNRSTTGLSGPTAASLDTVETETQTTTALEKAKLITGREVTKFESDLIIHFKQDTAVASTTYCYVAEVGDTIVQYTDLDDTIGVPKMRSTPAVGQTWSEGSSGNATVVGQEDVTVAAGTYKGAWKVRRATIIGNFYEWYAPGTGLVKMYHDTTEGGNRTVYDQELTSATIK